MTGEGSTEVAVGDDAEEMGIGIDDASGAERATGHLDDELAEGRAEGDGGEVAVHRLMDAEMEVATDLAGGVEAGEIGVGELADLGDGEGEGVAKREGRGDGTGGDAEGVAGGRDGRVEDHVGFLGERGTAVAEESDEGAAEGAEGGEELEEFGGGAGAGEEQNGVAGGEDADVAVDGFGGVEENGGEASGGERCRQLFSDATGLADAGEDHFVAGGGEAGGGVFKVVVEAGGGAEDGIGLHGHEGISAVDHGPQYTRSVMRILRRTLLQLPAAGLLLGAAAPRHREVFAKPGRFGGWPANHGMWAWGDELLVGFEAGWFKANSLEGREHSIDYSKPAEHVLARSLDGGETWTIEKPAALIPPPGLKVAGVPGEAGGKTPLPCPGGIDFTVPGFALTARMTSIHVGPSRFLVTGDRGKNWQGPYVIPDFGTPGIAARTDYIVDGPQTLTMFLTAGKTNQKEGRVICVRTKDGGKSFQLAGNVGPEPGPEDFAIMPSSLRLGPKTLLSTIRHRKFIAAWRSEDDGATWTQLSQPVDDTGGGNPPALVKLRDGRLVLTYGFRNKPYSIRARVSKDEGRTWGPDIMLRDDGGAWDLGYTRTVQRKDGKLVTVYYYNTNAGAERFIGATIWEA